MKQLEKFIVRFMRMNKMLTLLEILSHDSLLKL
jgi:hypothetical protein